jgi:hypothetical protein
MAFPSSPTDGQTYSMNGTTYVYSSAMGVWDKQGNLASASPVSSVAGRTGTVTLTAADVGAGAFPGALTGASTLIMSGNIVAASGTSSSSTTTGALVVVGGVGVSGQLTAGSLSISGGINGTAIGASSASTGAFTTLTASGSTQVSSLGIGTAATGTAGEIRATNAITAYYSDERLKNQIGVIENALDKIDELTGFLYTENDLAKSFGFNNTEPQVALSAQAVQRVQPEAVRPAPFDIAQRDDGTEYSKSGENYLTVVYERLIPLLVEGIKELRREVNQLKGK